MKFLIQTNYHGRYVIEAQNPFKSLGILADMLSDLRDEDPDTFVFAPEDSPEHAMVNKYDFFFADTAESARDRYTSLRESAAILRVEADERRKEFCLELDELLDLALSEKKQFDRAKKLHRAPPVAARRRPGV
jgi:hypothetical protein